MKLIQSPPICIFGSAGQKVLMLAVVWVVLVVVVAGTGQSSYAQTVQEIDAGIHACLGRFYGQIEGGREMAAMAEGILVIPGVFKAGLMLQSENGNGALRVGGRTVAYYSLVSGSAGFPVGREAKDIVILFMTADALRQFQTSRGWEIGVDGHVVLANIGSGNRGDFIRMNDPVIGFVFDFKGFPADISVKGAKFTSISPK